MVDYSKFQIILDTPAASPGLGFAQYATALKDIIERSAPRFAIGIFGSWGAGKTTLMNLVESRLDSDRVIAVRFTAWRYEKEEHLIVPLLDCIREAIVKWSDAKSVGQVQKVALRVGAAIGQATHALLHGFSVKVGIPNAIDLSFDANKALTKAAEYGEQERAARVPRSFYHASFKTLSDAFTELTKDSCRIVVFIDDLDRCLPAGALEVLESMKLFFDLDGFVFVVGLDRGVVERCIDAKYAKEFPSFEGDAPAQRVSGEDYIKKIFQVPINLAPVSTRQIQEYMQSIVQNASLSAEQASDLHGRVLKHLRYITPSNVNPRELKRYVNSYVLQMKMRPDLQPDVVLTLCTLRFRSEWRDANAALFQYREAFINSLNGPSVAEHLAVLDSDLATSVPDSLLEYVSAGSPGNVLLTVQSLDEYLYAGEIGSSGLGPMVIDLMRDATSFRLEIAKAKDPDEARPLVEQMHCIAGRLVEAVGSAHRATLLANELGRKISLIPQKENFEVWRGDLTSDSQALVQRLKEAYARGV